MKTNGKTQLKKLLIVQAAALGYGLLKHRYGGGKNSARWLGMNFADRKSVV